MEKKAQRFGYIRSIESKYGIFPTLSGAAVILAIVYVFMNAVDLFKVIEESPNRNQLAIIFVVAVGLIGGALFLWLIINSFKKKTSLADAVTVMMLIVGIGSCGIKYLKDGFNMQSISNEYFYFLGVALISLVLLIIHTYRYDSNFDDYMSYKKEQSNSGIFTYYKELIRRFELVWIGILSILCVVAILLIDANEAVPKLAAEAQGKKIIYIISLIAVGGYLIGIIQRLINKRINITDIGIFMMLIASICAIGVSVVKFVKDTTNADLIARLIIAISAFAFSFIASILLAKGTYIPSLAEEENAEEEEVVYNGEPSEIEEELIENEEPANEENQEEIKEDRKEDLDMAEQIKEIIARLDKQTQVNTSMNDRLMNIDKNIQLIAEILSGLSQDAIPGGSQVINVAMDQVVEEVPVAAAEEEVSEEMDYFEQLEKEKEIDEQNSQIADEFAVKTEEDNDFLATADDNVKMKPKLSFEMKLRNASDDIKKFYSDIKNELLSYGIHDRISRHRENFNQGRINICRMVINGKTLKVYLAVDPTSIDQRYFHQEDVGHRKGLVELPTMINVRSKVAARKVKELIGLIMESLVISKKNYEPQDFAKELTLDGFTTIEAKGFSHLVKSEYTKEEAETYPDAFAQQLIEVIEDEQYQEKFIKKELTLDELSKNFNDGDVVDVSAIREKGLAPKNCNYISIKESEKMSKKLKVYANEITPTAVKMVCLSGGEVFIVAQPEKTIETA